ncbi:uncharacterized protein LOC108216944 [Daucus carota subsp. sativus]|uniref:uncharacterized protein LOC108216944 n=1 Tax=Daucus carota subsp. sativus TaxID=79200 RepID=UPI0007EFFD33|nr:PREDICTED: uncharacterized protein LOC108216944 [Daucus carota subsp. sativus]
MVLLSKWWWRAYGERGSMWNKIMSEKYGPLWHYDLSNIDLKVCSPIVQSIIGIHANPVASKLVNPQNFKWRLGNGSKIYFWEDWWTEDQPLCRKFPGLYSVASVHHLLVKDFLHLWLKFPDDPLVNNELWLGSLSHDHLNELHALSVILQNMNLLHGNDTLLWLQGVNPFTTKSCYAMLEPPTALSHQQSFIWRLIWAMKVPPKIHAFLWKVQWNILPTRAFIGNRIEGSIKECPWCTSSIETVDHLLWQCQLAVWGWGFISKWWSIPCQKLQNNSPSLVHILTFFKSTLQNKIWQLVAAAVFWSIWLARNELVFSGTKIRKQQFLDLIFLRINKWGSVVRLIDFENDPLWKVNPQGAISVHHYKISREFWRFKVESYDYICAVDGAYGLNDQCKLGGGVGGFILNKQGTKVLIFSGPVRSHCAAESELEGMFLMCRWVIRLGLHSHKVVICSDSTTTINTLHSSTDLSSMYSSCDPMLQHLINVSIFIQFVPGYLNDDADLLAKQGLMKSKMFSWVHNSSA